MKRLLLLLALFAAAGCNVSDGTDDPAPATWTTYFGACPVTAVALSETTGEIYTGTTSDGLRYFNGVSWTYYLRENSALISNNVRDVVIDLGGICWVATDRGISLFNGSTFSSINMASTGGGLPSDDVRCLFRDPSGQIWVGTAAGATRYSGSGWTVYNTTVGLAGNTVLSIDHDGMYIWLGHNGEGVTILDSIPYTVIGTAQGLSSGLVRGIDFQTDGTAWLATPAGLNVVAPAGGVTVYTAATSNLPHDSVNDVVVDPADHVWIATEDGLAEYYLGWANAYDATSGLYDDSVRSCASISADAVFAGTAMGLNRLNSTGWTGNPLYNSLLPSNAVRDALIDGTDTAWYATDLGLARQTSVNTWTDWRPGASPLSGPLCACLYDDGLGDIWIGTSTGLNRFDGSTWSHFTAVGHGLPGDVIADITSTTDGDLWLAVLGGGVCRFDGSAVVQNYGTADGLPTTLVNCIVADGSDTVWAGTALGLASWNGTWSVATTADGLPSNAINDVAFGPSTVWAATQDGGVAVWDGTSWTAYGTSSGLPSNEARSVAVDETGSVYVATPAGLAIRIDTTWVVKTSANSALLDDDLTFVGFDGPSKLLLIGSASSGVQLYSPEHLID